MSESISQDIPQSIPQPKKLSTTDEGFLANFIVRRLVAVYSVPLAETTQEQFAHAAYDLNVIRYRYWLATREQGVTLAQVESLVTDENAPDVFATLTASAMVVIPGVGPAAVAIVNENRRKAGLSPLGTATKEARAEGANAAVSGPS